MPETIPIPTDLARALVAYLGEQRYRDVHQLIAGLQQAVAEATKPTEP